MNKIVVLGAAESGVGAAVLAQKKGFDVFISDMGSIKDKYKEMMQKSDCHGRKVIIRWTVSWRQMKLSKVPVFPIRPL
jgi:hypothetical protein